MSAMKEATDVAKTAIMQLVRMPVAVTGAIV